MTLSIQGASVRRGKLETLKNVSFDIKAGERVALIGHNGAGKTTLMKACLGLLPLFSGSISVLGDKPGGTAAREATAYLPENVSFHPALSGIEVLSMLAALKGADDNIRDLLDIVGLHEAAERRVGTYSKGMRQRLGLAQVLLANPKLAILDEPTSGLDPISRSDFYRLVDGLAQKGCAVLISSHALTELEAKTDRITVLRHGELVVSDSLSALRAEAGLPIRFHIRTTVEAADEFATTLGGQRVNGQQIELSCLPEQKLAVLSQITSLGSKVLDVDIIPPHLDDLYRYFSAEEQQ
ncbi:ABC transporter ATP-binding protein [Polycladidibacter stylochi]|uniref:ABC transporter ATP-binding protein n=1 Tax=Polycladidibacter stylochi TaxID=1807766 RepID=UPI00082DD8A3|nr:ABC transporter ATP-binding protein [Pseudovibrio stylochi]